MTEYKSGDWTLKFKDGPALFDRGAAIAMGPFFCICSTCQKVEIPEDIRYLIRIISIISRYKYD